jgi:hypothetical protein
MARLLALLGRLVGFAGAILTVVTVIQGWLYYFSYCPPTCEGVGITPLTNALQIVFAVWIVRGHHKARPASCAARVVVGLPWFLYSWVRLVLLAGSSRWRVHQRGQSALLGRRVDGGRRYVCVGGQHPTQQRQPLGTFCAELPAAQKVALNVGYLCKAPKGNRALIAMCNSQIFAKSF